MRIPYVFERFHFTHVYHYSHINWDHVETIDRRLGKLNCKLCLLTIDVLILARRIIYKTHDKVLHCIPTLLVWDR